MVTYGTWKTDKINPGMRKVIVLDTSNMLDDSLKETFGISKIGKACLLYTSVKKEEEDTREVKTITGKITKIAQAVLEGTSHYYLTVEGSDDIFDQVWTIPPRIKHTVVGPSSSMRTVCRTIILHDIIWRQPSISVLPG